MFSEELTIVKGLAPAADRFNSDPTTDWINMEHLSEVSFLVFHEGGTTGKATITLNAASDNTGTSSEAIAFRSREQNAGSDDGWADYANTSSSGVETTAGAEHVVEVNVLASELPADKPFVAVTLTEGVDDPVNGAVLAFGKPRVKGSSQPSVLS